MSRVTIALLTYNRLDYAIRTLESTLRNLKTSHHVELHIASDGDGPEYINKLLDVGCKYPKLVKDLSTSNSCRGGYGKNYNMMTHMVHERSDYILPLEDDWQLNKELDLDKLIHVLEAGVGIESIRLGYLGWTQRLSGYVEKVCGDAYLILDPDCPEHHVFSGHPRLETVAYERRVGLWPEGLLPGETEFDVATRNKEARIGVAWPMDLSHTNGSFFSHIGTISSYERT